MSFNETDLKLIDTAKRTMRILSKVIRDKDPHAVVKDEDLAALIGGKTLEEALADPELAPKIRDRLTTDLPQLNAEQEALAIVQLGPAIFAQLWAADADDDDDGPN
ncbi:MAG TPA: hypothetical protein VMS31_01295, partial [Pyrinomonadaceae bacterium]|nr:hypothetical protein [Pyrinomonadaceae bacterium]